MSKNRRSWSLPDDSLANVGANFVIILPFPADESQNLKEVLCNISSLTDCTGLFLESRVVYLMKIHTRLP